MKRLPIFKQLTDSSNKKQDPPIYLNVFYLTAEDLMYRYRTEKCPLPACTAATCFFYHHEKRQRRRAPDKFDYFVMRICPDVEDCKRRDSCVFVHNYSEKWFHPFMFRTKPCRQIRTKGSCHYGPYCAFLH